MTNLKGRAGRKGRWPRGRDVLLVWLAAGQTRGRRERQGAGAPEVEKLLEPGDQGEDALVQAVEQQDMRDQLAAEAGEVGRRGIAREGGSI